MKVQHPYDAADLVTDALSHAILATLTRSTHEIRDMRRRVK